MPAGPTCWRTFDFLFLFLLFFCLLMPQIEWHSEKALKKGNSCLSFCVLSTRIIKGIDNTFLLSFCLALLRSECITAGWYRVNMIFCLLSLFQYVYLELWKPPSVLMLLVVELNLMECFIATEGKTTTTKKKRNEVQIDINGTIYISSTEVL